MNLTNNHLDILKEICNIASGNAISALADFTGKKLDIYIPEISLIKFQEVPGLLGCEDSNIVGIFQSAADGFNATILFAIDETSAQMLTYSMLDKIKRNNTEHYYDIDITQFSEDEKSALLEISNILTGHYLNAIANLLGNDIDPSPPIIAVDMAGAILTQALMIYSYPPPDELFVIKTEIFLDNKKINGQIFMLPQEGTLDNVLRIIEDKYAEKK